MAVLNKPPEVRQSPDALLRRAGFRIVSRPKNGPARWRRGGRVFLEADAHAIAAADAAMAK